MEFSVNPSWVKLHFVFNFRVHYKVSPLIICPNIWAVQQRKYPNEVSSFPGCRLIVIFGNLDMSSFEYSS